MGYYLTEHGAAPAPENRPAAVSDCMGSKTLIGAPFGKAILSTKYWDSETKTLAYQLRDYGPEIAKWLSRDPLGEDASANYYVFVRNAGIWRIDNLGTRDCIPGWICQDPPPPPHIPSPTPPPKSPPYPPWMPKDPALACVCSTILTDVLTPDPTDV